MRGNRAGSTEQDELTAMTDAREHGRNARCAPAETPLPQQRDRAGAKEPLLSARETARRLAISERTLWNITHPRGRLRCVRPTERIVRYDVADVARFVEDMKSGRERVK